jgi:hypothetical protein
MSKYSKSLYQWEDSYFGGYIRVVTDHPYIHIPKEIEISYDKGPSGLYRYEVEKLCNIFLYRLVKRGLYSKLFVGCEVVIEKSPYTGKEKKIVVFDNDCIVMCLNILIDDGEELSNLFTHYEKFLKNIEIKYHIPDDDDKGKDDDGDDDDEKGKKEDEDDGKGGSKKSDEDFQKEMAETFSKCEERKPYSYRSAESACNGELKEKTTFEIMKPSFSDYKPSESIIKDAAFLVQLLDVSFDPVSDKIENLKCGKMSSHKIAEIPAGNTHIYHRVEEDQNTRPFSICILADESGSMKYRYLHISQNDTMKVLYEAFSQILPQDKIYVFGHSGHDTPVIRVYQDKYNQNFKTTIELQLKNDFNENYDGPVIENIYERIRQQSSDDIIFVCISDGLPGGHGYGGTDAIEEMKRVIEKCKRDKFITVGVGIGTDWVKHIYQYHTVVYDVKKEMVKNVSSIINQVVRVEFKS